MPQYIQDPQVGTALQRLFLLQGRVRPFLEEYVIPTVQIADLSAGQNPPLIRHVSAQFVQAAVAAEFCTLQISTPPGTILRVKRMVFSLGGAMQVNAFFGTSIAAAPANDADQSFTDQRVRESLNAGPAGLLKFGTQAAALATTQWGQSLPATPAIVIEPTNWIVGSTMASVEGFMELQFTVVNTVVTGSIEWEEFYLV